jgi:hypothetical protein
MSKNTSTIDISNGNNVNILSPIIKNNYNDDDDEEDDIDPNHLIQV